jgi:haloacetate dehalogenase
MDMTLFPGFEQGSAAIDGDVQIAYVHGGSGPPLLLLHGHPQTSAIWHRVAPALARRFTLVAADLRGYGDSSKPRGAPDHANYAKRTMARDMLVLMRSLGFDRFNVLAHDRGARVAHRLAADHPEAVRRLVLLDIAPTLSMYEQTSEAFARAYWHWFFLILPAPVPETMIGADPKFLLRAKMSKASASGLAAFAPEAWAEYERCYDAPMIHASCEDYRAAAGIDLEHDRADRDAGRKVAAPLLALWGEHGIIGRCFNPLAEWRRVAADVRGHAVPSGHYIPEEAPDVLAAELEAFFFGGKA